ncbi:DUF397 domain-containing protein [Streptomyces sp. 3214.6]|uniref:DUF397 domain-containing protein n=1 Tax=Streptomyces sp. 3214.6 TaxID=1882757 RepID=UPI00090B9A85|nr:DUF397 domain-containing protein [Streptomyces sp. 3214.6]SHI00563.1 protein of unknown function [Streptomyces sp. 3214.6]
MPTPTWQKSSYCAQGDSCVHVAADADRILLTESADPSASILTATPAAFSALLTLMKQNTTRHD